MADSNSASFGQRLDLLGDARRTLVSIICDQALPALYSITVAEFDVARTGLADKITRPRKNTTADKEISGEMQIPCSALCKTVPGVSPIDMASTIGKYIQVLIGSDADVAKVFSKCLVSNAYVIVTLTASHFASIIDAINQGDYLAPVVKTVPERVMIEYSQPNTHKAFHVGHMRNVALGDCLVRLYEQMGHDVIAANYFGDEGAHVAKCLWLLLKQLKASNQTIDDLANSIPVDMRGEFLGKLYADANDQLDLGYFTKYPFNGIIAAKVNKVSPHPDAAMTTWKVVELCLGSDKTATVVCGGQGYEVGDMVAYIPVGLKFKKIMIAPKNMKGIESSGMILSYRELDFPVPERAKAKIAAVTATPTKESGGKSKQRGNKQKAVSPFDSLIFVIEEECSPGDLLIEIGSLDKSQSAVESYSTCKNEAADVLHKLESLDPAMCALWDRTKHWSLDEFKTIYAWLGARFDHDFFESEVSDESKQLVMEHLEAGRMVKSNGAIGCDLSAYGLPFLILIKSNGAGLYATKDLSLAQRKFNEFNIDRSVYVVDAGQSLHFQQVFRTLEVMGYEKAKNCFHLAYGLVTTPGGKMSSRDGTVIYFSLLKQQLHDQILKEYLYKYVADRETAESFCHPDDGKIEQWERSTPKWTDAEIDNVLHLISIATIKYKMLNVDPIKDITFVLEDWTAKKGDTGPYLLYAYARINAILTKVYSSSSASAINDPSLIDLSLLSSEVDRSVLYQLCQFWDTINKAAYEYRPSTLCKFVFDLSQEFMKWYDVCPVQDAVTTELKATRVAFIKAIAAVLKKGLSLLGITTVSKM